ncbi:MAG: hypothetical protein FWH48_12470, partial [Oscillospiraceae bacterium]|nr:hypothetical protein [Oscillospiraceae bacterium]
MVHFSFDFSKRNRADDIIDSLIEKVLAAYPAQRLERIKAQSEATWKGVDNGHNERISYVVLNCLPPEEPKTPGDATDIQREMIHQLKMMLHNSVIDDEYYPAFSSGLEQVTIPSMFCCVKERISDSEHVKPIIHSPSEVYSLVEADIREGYVCYDMIRRMAYKYRRAGGRMAVYMTDIQGPFSCAAQMWGIQDFLCEFGDCPNETHHLLSLCTDAIIKYFHAMYEAVDGDMVPIHCHPVLWVPKDCGVAVSDDFFGVVGEHTTKEYSVPYLERIGTEFGGVTAHTCGNMNHLASLMNSMETLKALNFGISETNLAKYASECDPRIALIVHKSGLSINKLPLIQNTKEHIHKCAEAQRTTGVRIFATPQYTDEPLDGDNLKEWETAAK